jgi:hypothetical protein
MTKLFSSGGTKDIGPQHQRRGIFSGPPDHRASARVSSAKPKPTGFAAFKANTPTKLKSDSKAAPGSIQAKRDAAAKIPKSSDKPPKPPVIQPKFEQTGKSKAPEAIDYTSSLAIGGAGVDKTKLLHGGLKAQFDALEQASGVARNKYNWKDLGAPQNPNEAIMFLSQATQNQANDIYTLEISEEMFHQADDAIEQGLLTGSDLQWANDMRRQFQFGGPTAYVLDGKILNHSDDRDLISDYDKIQQFRAVSQNMIEGERQMKQDFVYGAVAHGQDMALQSSRNLGSAEAARISAQSAEQTARISAQSARETQQLAGEQAIAQGKQARETGMALEQERGKEERLTTETRGVEERATVKVRGAQERETLGTAGIEERKTQAEAAGFQMEQLEKRLASDEENIRTQGAQRLAQIDREMAAQGSLLDMAQAGDMALQENRQEHAAEEGNKNRALQLGDAREVNRSNMAQEQLKRDEMRMLREQNNITNLITIASNPALLFHLDASGILPGLVGTSIQGEDLAGMIGDLTASLDPNKPLPNIQGYNSMSPVQQDIESWSASATRGFGEGGMEGYLQGGSPFSRGQQSQIRAGSSRSPFNQGVI